MNFFQSLMLWRYWSYRAYITNSLKYRDSKLGLMWPVLSLIVVTLVLGTVWGILLNKEDKVGYFLYLLCGYSIWSVISNAVEQGCRDLSAKVSGGIPFFTVVLERSMLSFIPFLYMMPLVLFAVFYHIQPSPLDFASFLLAFVCSIFWVIGIVALLMSIISIVPDFKHLITAIMRLAFLATPIIWETERLGEYEKYVWFNPFYLPLETLRSSLLSPMSEMTTLFLYFFLTSLLLFITGLVLLRLRMKSMQV